MAPKELGDLVSLVKTGSSEATPLLIAKKTRRAAVERQRRFVVDHRRSLAGLPRWTASVHTPSAPARRRFVSGYIVTRFLASAWPRFAGRDRVVGLTIFCDVISIEMPLILSGLGKYARVLAAGRAQRLETARQMLAARVMFVQ